MNKPENETDYDDEIFSMSIDNLQEDNLQEDNHRTAVRYVRVDITALLIQPFLFKPSKKILVKLLDISSKGASIEFKDKLSEKKQVILELTFKDKRKFSIKSKIIYHKNHIEYGLKFDQLNNELGDYLLKTQNDLIFK